MPNNRIFYPVHTVAIKPDQSLTFVDADAVHGVQSFSMNTDFNLIQTNELGTETIYANVEGIPNIEASISKVLDGHPTPYLLATQNATAPTLIARSARTCMIGGAVYPDTISNATGDPEAAVVISGAFVDSVSYNFTTDGVFTEDTTFVSNNKLWYNAFGSPGPEQSNTIPSYGGTLKSSLSPAPTLTYQANIPLVDAPASILGIADSDDFNFELPTGVSFATDSNGAVDHADVTVMPTEIDGFTTSGTNPDNGSGYYTAHVSSFSASVSLAREDLNELGTRGPYFRAATFPVEVTSELQSTASQGDLVSALQAGIFGTGVGGACTQVGTNTADRTVRVRLCEGLRLYLGVRNRLQSVGYAGGDADGGNVTISYTYTNFNGFTVMHENDPGNNNGNFAWSGRAEYLTEGNQPIS